MAQYARARGEPGVETRGIDNARYDVLWAATARPSQRLALCAGDPTWNAENPVFEKQVTVNQGSWLDVQSPGVSGLQIEVCGHVGRGLCRSTHHGGHGGRSSPLGKKRL